MNVQFTTTTSSKLDTLTITNGQIIALSDRAGYYYDMGGVRNAVSGVSVVSSLPASGQSNMIYVLNTASGAVSYIWDSTESDYIEIGVDISWSDISNKPSNLVFYSTTGATDVTISFTPT